MAVICRAIDVIKNKNNNTSGYVLSDLSGNVMQVPSDKIKSAILSKQVIVSNLKVTSNNRLIKEDIDVSKKFIAIADRISSLSGVGHCKSTVKDFYFYTKFENTKAYLLGKIDDSEVTFIVKDSNIEEILNASNIHNVANLVKKLSDDYESKLLSKAANIVLNTCNDLNTALDLNIKAKSLKVSTQNNSISTSSNNDVDEYTDVQSKHRIITIDTSNTHFNNEKFAEESGIEYIKDARAFRIVDKNAIVVIKLHFGDEIVFINSNVHGFKVIGDSCRDGLVLKYCKMQYLESLKTNPQLLGCVIYNKATIVNGTLSCYYISYINNLKVSDYKNIDLEYIIGNNVIVEGTDFLISCTNCAQYIKNIKVFAEKSISMQGNSWTVENIELSSEYVNFVIDQYGKSTEKEISRELNDLNGNFTYPELYMIVCNNFTDADSVEANVDVMGKISITKLVWRCKFKNPIKTKASDNYSRLYNAEIIQDNIPKTMKIGMGGIAITNHTDITFTNLKIAALFDSRNKGYSLGDSGLFLIDSEVKNFSITIENSIKPATKNSVYDLNLVIRELKRMSEINPIKVYYGTQAYEILTTNGVKVDILNSEDISQNVKNTYAKERLIGVSIMDNLERTVSDALTGYDDTRYSIDTGINVELPADIISLYKLNVSDGNNSYINAGIKALLDMLKVFPANNLPFTANIVDNIKSNPKFRIKTELLTASENIMVNLVSIVYTDILDIDQYVVVTNGKNLIYMSYIGDCEIRYNKGSSTYIQDSIHAINKLDSVDLTLKSVSQKLTISCVKNTKQLINDIDDIFNKTTLFLYNSRLSSLLTVGPSGTLVTFKVGCKKYIKTKFDTNYERKYIQCIEKIESNDVLDSIKDDVAKSYSKSVLLSIDNTDTCDSDIGTISSCKVSSLWQLAHKYVGDINKNIITSDMLTDIMQLGFFNEITEKEFIQVLKKSDKYLTKYTTDGNFTIEKYSFHGKMKRLQGKYMGKIDYLHTITYFDGTVEYYTADESIDTIISYMRMIANYKSNDPFENYVKEFNFIKKSLNLCKEDADKIAYKMSMSYKDIRYRNVHGEIIYNAILEAENNHDYDRKLHLLKLIGMTDEEYEKLVSKNGYGDRNIDAEVIARMPKSKELLDLLKMEETYFDELVMLHKCDLAIYKLKHIARSNLNIIYSSRHKLRSTYEGYSTLTHIGVCKSTGYCYLFTTNRSYVLPVFRIASFKEAMLLRKQLMEEDDNVQKKDGLIQDLGWNHSSELLDTIEANLNNISDIDKYPNKYKHIVAYINEKSELEDIGDISIANNKDNNSDILSGYSQAYLIQFIQMGAVQIVASIPSSYKYNKTYSLDGVGYKAVEYFNSSNQMYAFSIGSDTNVISEYSFEELFS